MRRFVVPMAAVLWVAALAAAPPSVAPQIDAELRAVLLRSLGFTPADLGNVVRGKVTGHSLEGSDRREVGVVGAVLVRASTQQLVERVRDIARFKRSPNVLQIGRFGESPTLDDLAGLTITREDVDLRNCHVGDCDIRLPGDAIARFQREVDWTAPDGDARASALFKQILLDHVRAYLAGEPGRFTRYDGGDDPILPVDDFASLLKGSSFLGEIVPGLPAHLEQFPASRLPDVEDFLYWSKEKFGLTPFVTVTHVTIARSRGGAYVITSKDVYSSRYIDASLGVTIAATAVGAERAFHLVYANRSRAQALDGKLGSIRRSIARSRAKSGLEDNLRLTKARLERPGG